MERSFFQARARRVSKQKLSVVVQQLHLLFVASVPLVESLEILSKQESSLVLRESLKDLATQLTTGKTLSEAMMRNGDIFPNSLCAQVKLGETSGGLAQSLEVAGKSLESESRLRKKLQSAFAYPAFAGGLAMLFLAFVLLYFVPRMLDLTQGLQLEMPFLLKLLSSVAGGLTNPFVVFALAQILLALMGLFSLWRQSEVGSRQYEAALLHLPLVGSLLRRVAGVRFAKGMAGMLRCGCPLLQSLGLVASSLGNSEIEHELANAQRLVAEEGCSLSESLRATTEFEARVTQLIACGESSGRLVSCLEQIAELEEEDLERQLGDALNLVEPAILVFLGATVALVTLLFFLPMTQLLNSLS